MLANNVVQRLSKWLDVEALPRPSPTGLPTSTWTPWRQPERSAQGLKGALHDAEVTAEFDTRSDKHILRISRMHHGNVKSSVLTADFVHGADYEVLSTAGKTFKGLVGA